MVLRFGDAGDVSAVHANRQQHPIQQSRIALTNCNPIDHSRIGAVLELIAVVIVIVEVVLHFLGDPVVNPCDLFIVIGILQIQLCHYRIQCSIYLCLLFRSGKPCGHKGETVVIHPILLDDRAAKFAAACIVFDVIPFVGDSRMGSGKVIDLIGSQLSVGHNAGIDALLALGQCQTNLKDGSVQRSIAAGINVRCHGICTHQHAHKTQGHQHNIKSDVQLHKDHSFGGY